ncbi:MAG: undecaprenyl-diphosphate phosphatase [Actinobacteria bacterium]|nr:undecaprenyl-diphosphate phosphatase [Actinomycetota bacterium]
MNIILQSILKSILLGTTQGLTEFFPVSSSGHLVIIPYFFKWAYLPLYYAVILHFATLLSLLTVYYRDAGNIISSFFIGIFKVGKRNDKNFKLAVFIIIASVPAAITGFFLNDIIGSFFSKPLYVGIFLLITAIFLFTGEIRGKVIGARFSPNSEGLSPQLDSNDPKMNYPIAFIVGIGQAIAILPGLSRSGSTISFARFFGIKREECVKFSFLLSIPVIFGSFIYELYKSHEIIFNSSALNMADMAISFIFAYISGLLAIKFLTKLSRNRNLNIFAIYCIVMAVAIFIVIIVRSF